MCDMKASLITAIAMLAGSAGLCAAKEPVAATGFVNLPFSVGKVKRTAAIYVPPGYDKTKACPLIVYLHGGGGNGDNTGNAVNAWLSKQAIVRAIRRNPERFGALVLVPRCPRGKIWSPAPPDPVQSPWRLKHHGRKTIPNAPDHITKAIDAAMAAYTVDKDRVTLTGYSMGGEGTTLYAALHANRLAGIAPVAGSAVIVLKDAPALARMGVWIFQGETDNISTAPLARRMFAAIRTAGGKPNYTEYKGAGHGVAGRVFNDPKVIAWLLKQKRRPPPPKNTKPAGAQWPPHNPVPASKLSDKDVELIENIQRKTFGYFWDFAHPDSGLARERSRSRRVVTTGGSGFGILAILVAAERGWVTRDQALDRMHKIVTFLERADRFHGAWPHWLDGRTGKVIPFSSKNDDGADLVETSFLVQGLLTAREYFDRNTDAERTLRRTITRLWEAVQWNWFTNGEKTLHWHWSPKYKFEKNHHVGGWNECLITYVLAGASPTHPIHPSVYHKGWARDGKIANRREYLGLTIPLGQPTGGPLFFAHYSFLCLDPRNLRDRYANYWQQNVNHTRVNYRYCIGQAAARHRYSKRCWGLTASSDPRGYLAHRPGKRDNGTITPSAALASMPYTPAESLSAARYFTEELGDRLWGPYGLYDAFNLKENWFSNQHLAIDQGPIVVMIENYRTGLLWKTFMKCENLHVGLKKLGFTWK